MNKDPQQEVDEELRFHLEQRIRDSIARGMSPEAAREAAAQRFGDTVRVREACTSVLLTERAAEAQRAFVKVSWLDVKLGLRMLAKYPGLSLVAVGGMAIAIAFGAGYFALVGSFLDSRVPIDGGDRVVMISNRYVPGPDAAGTGTVGDVGPAAFDFRQWQARVKSVAELSAFRDDKRNLFTEDGHVQLVRVAAITASGLQLTRVPPLLGRTLLDEDERPGGPPVLVIGYEQWQRQFDGDAHILGRTVRLGDTRYTIVGVMPEGFAFPILHSCWVSLRLTELDANPGGGPPLNVFGRIADGYSLSQARAEFTTIGHAMATAFPQSHGSVRPEVVAYAQAFIGIEAPEMQLGLRSLQFGAALLLLIVAVNVAILVYARTATRFGEIAVRTALGATRGRVITQLFVEALVLSIAAATMGLTLLMIAFGMFRDYLKDWPDRPDWWPYWIEPRVSAEVIVYGGVLAGVAAVLIGVLPALKATGKRVQADLKQFSSRGAGMQLGHTWTALIVVQVAFAVAALPGTTFKAAGLLRMGTLPPAATAATLLRGTLHMPSDSGTTSDAQFTERMTTLMQRMQEQPEVSAVTFADAIPGAEGRGVIEPESPSVLISSHVNFVATNLFDVFDVRVLAGRGFTAADAHPKSPAVIVDQAFADRLAPGGNVIGRRIRFPAPDGASEPNPWMEIVGVVPVFSSGFTPSAGLGPSVTEPLQGRCTGRVTSRNSRRADEERRSAALRPEAPGDHRIGGSDDGGRVRGRRRRAVGARAEGDADVGGHRRRGQCQRAAALRSRHPRDDVVHRGETLARDRDPRGAGRRCASCADGHLRPRERADRRGGRCRPDRCGDPRVDDAGRECRRQGADPVPDGRGGDVRRGAAGRGWPGAPRAGD